MTNYTCQCSRCDGRGTYDRGTCFACKGVGYENKTRQPRGLHPFSLVVTYSNGSNNKPTVWASSKSIAVQIVERMLAIKGWTGTVA